MLPLTKEELKLHQDATNCYICGKRILKKLPRSKSYWKVRDHCHCKGKYRDAAHSICNLKFNVPNKILIVFHNVSNYDYHFIMKELANKFEGKFECLGKNTEKYKTFSVPIEEESESESVVTISYKLKFIDSARWQLCYQILLIISQREFTKLNIKILIVFLNMKVSRTIQ